MKKLLFIYNPRAGRGKVNAKLTDIIHILSEGGYHVSIYPTKAAYDAHDYMIQHEAEYDVVVISGGDGTLHEAVAASLENAIGTPLGFITGGTMNDWAANLGIPSDPCEAAKVIAEGKPVAFDVCRFNNDLHFNYVAAFGAFTEISYNTPQQLKKIFGPTAYGFSAIKSLTQLKPYEVRVECDDDKVLEGKYMFGMACNSKFVGNFKLTGMPTDMHDGKFEMVLIKEIKNPLNINQLFSAAIFQDYVNSDLIEVVRTSKARFIFKDPISWTLDGEFGGTMDFAEVETLPSAVKFIIRDAEPVVWKEKDR